MSVTPTTSDVIVTGVEAQALALPLAEEHGEYVVYRLTFPFAPPSKNVYDSWPGPWKSSAKKKWLRAVAEACAQQGVPCGQRHVGLAATIYFPTRQRRDPQNYAQALWNFVPDALVRCGVLIDDRDGAIEIGPQWGVRLAVDGRPIDRKRRYSTVVTVAVPR